MAFFEWHRNSSLSPIAFHIHQCLICVVRTEISSSTYFHNYLNQSYALQLRLAVPVNAVSVWLVFKIINPCAPAHLLLASGSSLSTVRVTYRDGDVLLHCHPSRRLSEVKHCYCMDLLETAVCWSLLCLQIFNEILIEAVAEIKAERRVWEDLKSPIQWESWESLEAKLSEVVQSLLWMNICLPCPCRSGAHSPPTHCLVVLKRDFLNISSLSKC